MAVGNSESPNQSDDRSGEHAPDEQIPVEHTEPSAEERIGAAALALKTQGDNGANWFFWVAGLSLVNTVIAHSGGDRHFIVGLSFTAIVDAVAGEIGKQHPEAATIAVVIAVGFSCFVAIIAALFGWMSRKRWLAAFVIGMVIYVLDGLLYLLIGDYMSAGFHAFALWSMIAGFNAYRKLNQLEEIVRAAHDQKGESYPIDESGVDQH
jgi:hypothetical protein